MSDPIERQDVIDVLSGVYHYMGSWLVQYIEDGISSIPSAQPDCTDCIMHGGDWECNYNTCHKGMYTSSRQAAIDAFDCTDELIVSGSANAQNVVNYINKVIDKINALPGIIHCPDCKYGVHSGCGDRYICTVNYELRMEHDSSFYCGYGRRKE